MTRARRPPPSRWDSRRREIDEWITTLSRPIGLALGVYAGFVDKGRNPALIPMALALFGYKWVRGKQNGDGPARP